MDAAAKNADDRKKILGSEVVRKKLVDPILGQWSSLKFWPCAALNHAHKNS